MPKLNLRFILGLIVVLVIVLLAAEILLQPTSADRTHYVEVFALPTLAAAIVEPIIARWTARRSSIAVALFIVATSSLALGALSSASASRAMLIDERNQRVLMVVLLLASGLAFVMGIQLSRPMVADIVQLGEVADRVTHGDLSVRTRINRRDELGRTARDMDTMIQSLADAEQERRRINEARQMLLTSIGHDLRTPLAAMRAAVESLQDGIDTDPSRVVSVLDIEVRNIAALIGQLTAYARIESGGETEATELVSVSEIAHEAVEAFTPVAMRAGVDLYFGADDPAYVDAITLDIQRSVRNLIDNAIEHAPSGGWVEVVVDHRSPQNGTSVSTEPSSDRHTTHKNGVTIRVLDNGSGFPEHFRERAFEPFARADTARTSPGGHAGLGLAITRGLIEKHGGKVWLGDAEGGDVRIWLPGVN